MMDWYLGHDIGETYGSKDQVYFDRLPSPDSWSNWGVCGIGNPTWPNYFDDAGNMVNDLSDERFNHPDGELELSSDESLPWNHLPHACPSMQFHHSHSTGTDTMDDMFLSSLLHDDAPTATQHRIPVNLPLPSQCALVPIHRNSAERTSDFQSMSCDADGVGCSEYIKSRPFSPSTGSDNGHPSVPNVTYENSLDQSNSLSLKALETMDMVLSDQEAGGEDSSMEESVLIGLENVLNQLSSKTRLCFRDSLYRLAQRSQPPDFDEVLVEDPPQDRTPRTSSSTGESETNTIDRAVANLMFQNPCG